MTYLEKVKKERPEDITTLGIPRYCPNREQPVYCGNDFFGNAYQRCTKCWNTEIPEEKEKENKPMKKTKAMLEEELDQKRAEIEDLKKELAKAEKYKQYDDMAGEVKAIYDSFVNAGFNEDQAFVLLNTMINNQKSAEPVYRSSRYPTAAFRK